MLIILEEVTRSIKKNCVGSTNKEVGVRSFFPGREQKFPFPCCIDSDIVGWRVLCNYKLFKVRWLGAIKLEIIEICKSEPGDGCHLVKWWIEYWNCGDLRDVESALHLRVRKQTVEMVIYDQVDQIRRPYNSTVERFHIVYRPGQEKILSQME